MTKLAKLAMSSTFFVVLPWFLLELLTLLGKVSCHGRLWEPPARSTMWRRGYNTAVNINDNELSCGGYKNHWVSYRGRCGVCGDPYQQHPRDNEHGGLYASGIITRAYPVGGAIDVTVDLTANHGGYFEFKLCPVSDVGFPATHECMDRHRLKIIGAPLNGYRYPILVRNFHGFINMSLALPGHFYCNHCVLQWVYKTGTRWGCDPDMTCGKGRGPQEEFYGCADIAVTNNPNVNVNYGNIDVNPVYVAKNVKAITGRKHLAGRNHKHHVVHSHSNKPIIGRRRYAPIQKQAIATMPQLLYSRTNLAPMRIKSHVTGRMNNDGNWAVDKPLSRLRAVSPTMMAHYVNKFPTPASLYLFLKRNGMFHIHPDKLRLKYNHIVDSHDDLHKQFHMVARDAVSHYYLKKMGRFHPKIHGCQATGKFEHNPIIQEWCRRSCQMKHAKCSPNMCVCNVAMVTPLTTRVPRPVDVAMSSRVTRVMNGPQKLPMKYQHNGNYQTHLPPKAKLLKSVQRNIFRKTLKQTPVSNHLTLHNTETLPTSPFLSKQSVKMDKHLRVKMVDNHGFIGNHNPKSYSPSPQSIAPPGGEAIDGAPKTRLARPAHVVPRTIVCSASQAFAHNKHMKVWCRRNCEFGFCPVSVCSCT